jgi:hypothetical protein
MSAPDLTAARAAGAGVVSPVVLQRAERALSAGTWLIVGGAVLFSVLTVTPLMAAHTPPGWKWTAPILPIVVDAAVVIVVRLDSVLARMGADGGRWPVTLRWMTGLFTLLLNTGSSLIKRDPVGAAVHAVAPLLLIVTSETGLAYRRAIGREIDRAARQAEADRAARQAERAAAERARLEDERAEREAARAAEAERMRLEDERERARLHAEQERIRLETEQQARAEAERTERERLRLEAEREQRQAEREAEKERARLEAERARAEAERVERERERRRVEAEHAERERERARAEAEHLAAERERRRVEAERAAAERERRRVEAERLERERERAALLSSGPAVERLPEERALTVVRAAAEEGMSVRATAELCGWSVGWVSKQLRAINGTDDETTDEAAA